MLDPLLKIPFKFVKSIRKKVNRDNLQGASCKLCKKFYDIMSVGNAQDMVEYWCNHLENSYHRYRDLPLATLKGF